MRSTLPLSDSEFESEADWMLFWLSCTVEVKILLQICAFTTLTLNVVVINIKFKFTNSKGWHLVSVIEIFSVNVCIPVAFFLYASCYYLLAAYLFSFQCHLDAQYNLQQAFLKQCIFQRTLWLSFYPLLWAYPLETTVLFELEADNHQVCGHS